MLTPGERMASEVKARHEKLQFYVDSLTNIERSKLAARFLRKVPAKHRLYLLKRSTIAQLAFAEVFSQEVGGW